MSGSNTICVATVLLETGMVELHEPETILRLEAPAGVVEARCACRNGRVESVELTNVTSYATHLDAVLDVDGFGSLTVDVAFGGMWYAIADASALGFELVPHEARDLCAAGEAIRVAAREQLSGDVSIVQLAGPWQGVGAVSRNAVVVAPGRLDRSATGTGLSARMATLHARGMMRVGDAMTHASVIGSTFDGRIVAEAGNGIVPAIRGSAFITGRAELYVDDRDPYPEGYLVGDTWPGDDVQH
jgi:trans-L-3-hydroxyproline dehydratase